MVKKAVRKKTSGRENACYPSSWSCGEDLQSEPDEMPTMSIETAEQGASHPFHVAARE
jgi:hypothetical protein